MTKLLAIAAFSLLSASAFAADSVTCSTYTNLPGTRLSGNCSNNQCQAQVQSNFISTSGFCNSTGGNAPIRFDARGNIPMQFLSFRCQNGSFSGNLYGQSVSLSGSCSNGGRYTAVFRTQNQFLSGSCRENGPIDGFIYGETLSIDGRCDF